MWSLSFAASAKTAEPTKNAALAYWQAFALLPTVDKDLDKLVIEAPTVKLDDRTKELVKKSKTALTCMRRAASLPACDWGLEFSAGPHMVMPHLSKPRQLARYACLHARQLRNIVVPADEAPGGKDVTRKQIAKWLDGTTKDYDEIHAIFDLPNDEFQPRWDALVKRIRAENPYSSVVLPALKNVREVRDRGTATWALFRTAIAVQRDGKERLATIKDPFGDGPFQYKKLPAGFRLTSKFSFRGKQAELTVGPVANR